MPRRTVREIDRFYCEDDDGNEYVVIEYQHYAISETLNRAPQEVPTTKECRLRDGKHVNVLGGDLFEIVETDVKIRKV